METSSALSDLIETLLERNDARSRVEPVVPHLGTSTITGSAKSTWATARGASRFLKKYPQDAVMERTVGDELFKLPILFAKRPQPARHVQ